MVVLTLNYEGLDKLVVRSTRIETSIKKAIAKDMERAAKVYSEGLRKSARITKKPVSAPWQNLPKAIRARKLNDKQWGVELPLYGIFQDRMKPHWVTPALHLELENWVRTRAPSVNMFRPLFVRPTPWITQGFSYGNQRMKDVFGAGSNIAKALKKK